MTTLTRPTPVVMGDSTNPAGIPTSVRYAAAYRNGLYQWSDADIRRFSGTVEIAVYSGQPEQAEIARVLDVERYDASPADAGPFVASRQSLGHHDATIYMSLDSISAVVDSLQADDAVWHGSWRLWPAWWTLQERPPTTAQLVAAIRTVSGVTVPAQRLWACQWQSNPTWDRSIVYGPLDFIRHKN